MVTSSKGLGYGTPEGRLIGFKAIVSSNMGGTYENIRQLAIITDDSNCEEAKFTFNWDSFP